MASKMILPQMALVRRQMASMASKKTEAAAAHQLENSLLPSGLKVTSLDSDSSGISTLGVMVKAGSGFESYENLGASQALRLNVGLATQNATSFSIVKNIQQNGGNINVIGSREYLLYILTSPRHLLAENFDFFSEVVTSPSLKFWDINDWVNPRMKSECDGLDQATFAIELLHKAAYRNGLGNSLYAPDFMIGHHGPDLLQSFHHKTHTVTRSVVAGHGIDHLTACRLSGSLQLEKGHGPTQPNKYFGGEERENGSGNTTVIAIAAESCAATNAKESLAFMLLKNVLGTGQNIKRGSLNGKLGKAVAKIEGQKAVAGINFAYQDTGLIGAVINCEASIAGNVTAEVVAALKSVSVTDEELQAAKKTLLMESSESMLNGAAVTEFLASSSMHGVESSFADLINMVSTADLNAAAKKMANGKLSMSAVGNLRTLPYLDSL